MIITNKQLEDRLKDVGEFVECEYKPMVERGKRDWRTYEQQLGKRIRESMKLLKPLIDEAVESIETANKTGRPPELTLNQKVTLLLVKQLCGKSNRKMSAMLVLFSLLSEVDVSYKTVERLYSDPEVELALQNLQKLVLKKRGVERVDASGDGTGYSLSIKQHYSNVVEQRKDDAKINSSQTHKTFAYSFPILDLKTKMYIATGISFKSEKQAFLKATENLQQNNIVLDSIRLDKYYSNSKTVDKLNGTKVYVIPKCNATINGSYAWKQTLADFVFNTFDYLFQYYYRECSEAEFSADKRCFGPVIVQRRFDRIETAINSINLWHNLFRFSSS